MALAMARRRPGRIRRLILHAPAGFRPRSARLAEAVAAAAPLALAVRRRAGRPVAGIGLARRALLWGAIHDPSRLTTEQAQSMLEASRRATQLREAAKAAIAADLAEDLEKLDAPVGFIWGDHDPLMPRSTREVLRRLRPEAPIRVIPEAAHVAQLARPAAFAEAVEFLLDRLTSGPAVSAR